jgi:hypothetical protein
VSYEHSDQTPVVGEVRTMNHMVSNSTRAMSYELSDPPDPSGGTRSQDHESHGLKRYPLLEL